jgi:hypothetical protein
MKGGPCAAVCILRKEIKLLKMKTAYCSQKFLISSPPKCFRKCEVDKGPPSGVKDQRAKPLTFVK